jgi:DNA helicase II / ATP-dependent DNA helicase PcrA
MKPTSPSAESTPNAPAATMTTVVADEDRCLQRVLKHVEDQREPGNARKEIDYDTQLLQLRDEIAAARNEDVPPLLEQMERLQGIATRQRMLTKGYIDPRSPYFGRMVLEENDRKREVMIGRSTYLDSKSGIRIVDWRDAPVSRLYYRYNEGDSYEERFGDKDVEGEVLLRRSVTIVDGRLKRITSPQGTFVRNEQGEWIDGGASLRLTGGQGSAIRAEQHRKPGTLGIGSQADADGDDKHLREITALIDPRQFDLITRPDSGPVVIQGGAGSGKTTIGLHRLAYLAFQDRRRFRPDKMLVVVFNQALARYISQVLPALDVSGVPVKTYEDWASEVRKGLVSGVPKKYSDDTPQAVTRLKKNTLMVVVVDAFVAEHETRVQAALDELRKSDAEFGELVVKAWKSSTGRPLLHRVAAMERVLQENAHASLGSRHVVERALARAKETGQNLVAAWMDVISDVPRIRAAFKTRPELALADRELERALAYCRAQCDRLYTAQENKEEKKGAAPTDEPDDYSGGIDGLEVEDEPTIDREDDTLLLLLWQRLRGPLLRPPSKETGVKEALVYEHLLLDEAQDLSPVELRVLSGCTSPAKSITLAGDVAQRLYMDNGFLGWEHALGELGMKHVAVEPLRLSYRSTAQILDFARSVLGHLAEEPPPQATRHGAELELFRFADNGEAVGFLADALRELMLSEPRSSVALIARHPQQADVFYQGLAKAEVSRVRRVADQDFLFKPGIDVTDVRQVKGLEFDYVILVDVSDATYPTDDESRHLLHIAATRAAHQLWLITSANPSLLIPQVLRERSY